MSKTSSGSAKATKKRSAKSKKLPDERCFSQVIPLKFSSFRPPKTGDSVVPPIGTENVESVWPFCEKKVLESSRDQCSCYTCSTLGSCGSVTVRIRRELHQYSDGHAFEDARRCVAVSEVARPIDYATPLHAALAMCRKDGIVLELLSLRPEDAETRCSGLYAVMVAFEAYPESQRLKPATILAILSRNTKAAQISYVEADPAHPNGGFLLHAAIHTRQHHLVVEGVLRAYPPAVRETDRKGELPIHTALRLGASDATIVALVKEFPEAAKFPYPHPLELAVLDAYGNLQHNPRATSSTIDDDDDVDVNNSGQHLSNVVHVTLSSPNLLTASLILRRSFGYGALRCTGRKGRTVAKLMQNRSATLAILSALPTAAASQAEYVRMRPLHIAATLGASLHVVKALAKHKDSHHRDGDGNTPLHIAILRDAPSSIIKAIGSGAKYYHKPAPKA